jgi:membrane protease YdiL (CAAX protease family)
MVSANWVIKLFVHPQKHHSAEDGWWQMLIQESFLAVIVAAATSIMALIERRKPWAYFLGDRAALVKLAQGAGAGLVTMTALVGLLIATHALAIDRLLLDPLQIVGFGFGWLAVFALVALFEESFFRGYIQFTLTRGINFGGAAVITSVFFGFAHLSNQGENLVGILNVFAAGALLCFILRLTGSLYWAIGFHATWDWTQSFLFGVADSGQVSAGRLLQTHPVGSSLMSGGSAGPEGSLLALMVMAIVAVILWAVYGKSLPQISTRRPVVAAP